MFSICQKNDNLKQIEIYYYIVKHIKTFHVTQYVQHKICKTHFIRTTFRLCMLVNVQLIEISKKNKISASDKVIYDFHIGTVELWSE
jgi:hypothetical protein